MFSEDLIVLLLKFKNNMCAVIFNNLLLYISVYEVQNSNNVRDKAAVGQEKTVI